MEFKDLLAEYKSHLLVIAIIFSSIAVSIKSIDGEVSLVLGDYPIIIFLLVVLSSFLVVLYLQANKRNITKLTNEIKTLSGNQSSDFDSLFNELTDRQKEVYNLIILGLSNKEIMSKLFIEQSTLKTHINQIYKKLNIKSRGELKLKSKHNSNS